MRAFVLGLICGVIASAVVAATTWPTASRPDPSPDVTGDRAPSDAPERRRVMRDQEESAATEKPPTTRASDGAPEAVVPVTDPAAGDPLADARRWISERQPDGARRAIHTLASQGVTVPRDIVDDLARWVPDADNPFEVRNTLQEALGTWEPEAVEALLREIVAGTPGALSVENALLPAVEVVAARGHELNALAQQLAVFSEPSRQRAAVLLASTSRRPDPEFVGRLFDAASDAAVRAHAMRELVAMTGRSPADSRTRATAGRIALRVLRGDSTREERESAVLVVHLAGEEGLDVALKALLAGGLSGRREEAILAGLIDAGRLPRLLQESAGNAALLSRIAFAVFNADEPREADVVALWPLIPELVSATEDGAAFWPEIAAGELGRFDLVEEMARDARLPASFRAAATQELLDNERSDAAHGLDVVMDLVFDPSSDVELRRAIVETLSTVWSREDERHADRLLALVDRIARDDPVEWVRYDASDVAAFVRQQRSSR